MENTFIFDNAERFIDGYACVMLNNLYGIINTQGQWIIKPEYEYLSSIPNNRFIAKRNSKYGIIDKDKNTIIPFKYDYLELFLSEKYLSAKLDNKYGVIDLKGNTIIPFEYEYVSKSSTSYFEVIKDFKWGCVDLENKTVIPFVYDDIYLRTSDYIILGKYKCVVKDSWVSNEPLYGILDYQNNVIIPFEYMEIMPFDKDLSLKDNPTFSAKTSDDTYIIIDSNNEKVCPIEFNHIAAYSDTLYPALVNYKSCVIDRFGKIKIPTGKFKDIELFKNFNDKDLIGLVEISDNQKGFITQYGEILFTFDSKSEMFDIFFEPKGNSISIYKDNKWGVVDTDNNIILPFIYDGLNLSEPYNTAKIKDKWGFIDDNGRALHIQPTDIEPENKNQLKLFKI